MQGVVYICTTGWIDQMDEWIDFRIMHVLMMWIYVRIYKRIDGWLELQRWINAWMDGKTED